MPPGSSSNDYIQENKTWIFNVMTWQWTYLVLKTKRHDDLRNEITDENRLFNTTPVLAKYFTRSAEQLYTANTYNTDDSTR